MEAEAECESKAAAPPQPEEEAPPNSSSIAQPPPPPASLMSSAAFYPDDADSACSSPYFSAPSSPGRSGALPLPHYCYYFSAPTSPVHYVLASLPYTADGAAADGGGPSTAGGGEVSSPSGSSEFEFSARFSDSFGGGVGAEMMCPADELFLNGQIRPMRLACHLERPQTLAPLPDAEGEGEDEIGAEGEEEQEDGHEKERSRPSVLEDDFPAVAVARGREHFFSKSKLRNRSIHRRARSMSPLRSSREPPFAWRDEVDGEEETEEPAARLKSASRRTSGVGEGINAGSEIVDLGEEEDVQRPGRVNVEGEESEEATTPSVSASSSRCSSSGRNSKRWIFLKDLLYRSKSEGRGNEREREIRERDREKFWHNISFSPAKDKAAALFAFSRAAKLKEKQPTSAEVAADGVAAEGAGAEAEVAVSADPEQAPAVPSSTEPTTKQEVEDEKKKKQKPKLTKQKNKKKNEEEPSPAPATTDNLGSSRAAPKPAASAGVAGKRRMTSAHERHYAAKRAQAEELRKRTFLPYRQGLLGCLGFSSRGYTYTAVTGLARTLNTVSSR